MLGRYGDASDAFANATRLVPGDAQLLADYADSLAMAQGRRLKGEPEKLISRALKADPGNVKALALAATVAFDRKDYAGATRHWQRIVQTVPPQSDTAQAARASIEEARALQGRGPSLTPSLAQAADGAPRVTGVARIALAQAADGAPRVTGVARIAPALAGKVSPNDTVFIYARAAEGARMPLAIVRKQARELPASFVLDDSMAMSPQMKLSSVPRVVVFARVSKTSEATPRRGDLQGQSPAVAVGAEGLEVLIDTEVR
jgi:cytochrome c-type biogenesis protein CcmH